MKSAVVEQPTLVPEAVSAATAIAPAGPLDSFRSMMERLAANPDVNVEKLERLIAMQERILAHEAESAFNAAFSQMQPEIPVIIERGKTDKGTFAELEDIVEVVRPILARFGFALSHQTEWPDTARVRVVGILTHREGHQRRSEFLSGADQSGSKNAIQALGSAVSYGRRYTTKDLLCIVTRKEDDDGQRTERPAVQAPDGFEDWWLDLLAIAEEGTAKLHEAWNNSKQELRRHVLAVNRTGWETLKKKAASRA